MTLKHNKKRNVGLLSEFFARYIGFCVIEHRDADLKKARELFQRHFHKGTDLHRELKLFTALYETKLTTKESASSLISQVKEACKLQSQARIDLEKTALLHEINKTFNSESFFNQNVDEYKDYATIQLLLNHWRGGVLLENYQEVAQLEEKVLQRLIKPVVETKTNILEMGVQEVDGLVLRLMNEKMNRKYNDSLNQEQKQILQMYVFSKNDPGVKARLSEELTKVRTKTLKKLDESLAHDPEAKKAASKLGEIKEMLLREYHDTSDPNDKTISFYLSISKLNEELSDE